MSLERRREFEDGSGEVIIELKSVNELQMIHAAQILTYMKLARLPIGLLVNFNVASLRNGIRRFDLKEQ